MNLINEEGHVMVYQAHGNGNVAFLMFASIEDKNTYDVDPKGIQIFSAGVDIEQALADLKTEPNPDLEGLSIIDWEIKKACEFAEAKMIADPMSLQRYPFETHTFAVQVEPEPVIAE